MNSEFVVCWLILIILQKIKFDASGIELLQSSLVFFGIVYLLSKLLNINWNKASKRPNEMSILTSFQSVLTKLKISM